MSEARLKIIPLLADYLTYSNSTHFWTRSDLYRNNSDSL